MRRAQILIALKYAYNEALWVALEDYRPFSTVRNKGLKTAIHKCPVHFKEPCPSRKERPEISNKGSLIVLGHKLETSAIYPVLIAEFMSGKCTCEKEEKRRFFAWRKFSPIVRIIVNISS